MNKTARDYRMEAMDLLVGKYQKPILFYLTITVISAVYAYISRQIGGVHWVVNTSGLGWGYIQVVDRPFIYWLLNIGDFILASAIAYSVIRLTILIIDNAEYRFEDAVLSGFKNDFGKNIGTNFIKYIFVFLWMLLLIIPGIVKSYAYSMTFYFRNRIPDLAAIDAITKSKDMMDGHKMDLFILDLTYLGWYLLSAFTFGILLLWVVPRHMTARTLFFNDVYGWKKQENANGKAQPKDDLFD